MLLSLCQIQDSIIPLGVILFVCSFVRPVIGRRLVQGFSPAFHSVHAGIGFQPFSDPE